MLLSKPQLDLLNCSQRCMIFNGAVAGSTVNCDCWAVIIALFVLEMYAILLDSSCSFLMVTNLLLHLETTEVAATYSISRPGKFGRSKEEVSDYFSLLRGR